MNFEQAFSEIIKREGGYVDHPSDPGGKTNYGITERVARQYGYTGHMKDLPLSTAKHIYRTSYWDKISADLLPPRIRFHVLDAAVHSGTGQAIKWLQEAGGVDDDGIIGKNTMAAAHEVSPAKYSALRLKFLTGLAGWSSFGKGWARRIADNLEIE